MSLSERLFLPVIYNQCHWKLKAKFQLLITQMTLEMKLRVPRILINPVKIGYKTSDNLMIVHRVASELIHENLIKEAIIECPISAIVIPGITLVTEREYVHICVLFKLILFY